MNPREYTCTGCRATFSYRYRMVGDEIRPEMCWDCFTKKFGTPLIHLCHYAGQPDIGLKCGGWTEPRWGQKPVTPQEGIYWGEPFKRGGEYLLYTFGEDKVTCPQCLKLIGEFNDFLDSISEPSEGT